MRCGWCRCWRHGSRSAVSASSRVSIAPSRRSAVMYERGRGTGRFARDDPAPPAQVVGVAFVVASRSRPWLWSRRAGAAISHGWEFPATHTTGDRRMRLAWTLCLCALLRTPAAQAAGSPRPLSPTGRSAAPAAANVLDVTHRIDANTLDMALSNVGAIAYDLADTLATHGLLFPKGTANGVVFAGGFWLGAAVNGAPRLVTSEYETEYLPGAAAGGLAEPAGASTLKVYKLFRSYASTLQRDAALADYNDGALTRGAPVVSVRPDGKL